MNNNSLIIWFLSILWLLLVWGIWYLAKSPYYIIDINDKKYSSWCNSEWLDNPSRNCILSMYGDNSRVAWWNNNNSWVMYVIPADFEKVVRWFDAFEYCNKLNLWGVEWEPPISHDATRRDLYKAQDKIYNLTAEGSSKSNHYWADDRVDSETLHNCRLDWACWSERSSVKLSVRCISWKKPSLWMSFSNIFTNYQYYSDKLWLGRIDDVFGNIFAFWIL